MAVDRPKAVLKRSGRPAGRPASRPRSARSGRPLGRRVWNIGRIVLLVAGLVATYGLFFLTAARVASRARDVRVPDVRGATVPAATETLARAGLVLKVDPQRRPDAKVAADHVLQQEPEPGATLRRQRAVRIVVSDGQRDPQVPSVVGQLESNARTLLDQAHIAVGSRAEIRSADVETNVVVAQDPHSPERTASVSLLVNRERVSESYVMPDLIGAPAARVMDMLRTRFRVAPPTLVPYPNLPPGIVVKQQPPAGFRITVNDTITIEVTR